MSYTEALAKQFPDSANHNHERRRSTLGGVQLKDRAIVSLLALCLTAACVSASHHQRTPQQVVDAHLAGLNACDFQALMALYSSEVHLFLPGGKVVNGRKEVASIYQQTVKPFKDGGVCGLKFEADVTFIVGETVNVRWRATSAELLSAPYLGADAYVTKNGMMWAQVTTYDRAAMKAQQ